MHNKDNQSDAGFCGIGLSNPKTPSNVGSVLRASVCLAADEIFYTGERYDRAQRFNTNTMNHHNSTPLTHINSFSEVPGCSKSLAKSTTHERSENTPPNLETVCVELVENATPLPEFQHPKQALYIFGPEDYSLSQDLVDRSDHVVFIPVNHCLNLSATVNIVLYDRMVKNTATKTATEYNRMIKLSRDCRNNLTNKTTSKT